MKVASGLSGVESVAIDKDQKLTVIGDVDPVKAAKKLGKLCHTEIVSVGPAKEPEKKKEEPKKPAEPKKEPRKEPVMICYPPYYPPFPDYYYKPIEEHPPACIIS
ncbi:hypothetical protein Gogos_007125 [Gossypium gossypioides]|uniref:HMA domain-containing protein n=1 Tax=Gossypium gossypioides TaxID=34282 RepID=A0A7J9C7P5_GOSGO|nr:hypothetical protein [Gossypium gossypioides]